LGITVKAAAAVAVVPKKVLLDTLFIFIFLSLNENLQLSGYFQKTDAKIEKKKDLQKFFSIFLR